MPRRPLALRSSAGAAIRTRHPAGDAIALGRPTALVAVVRVGNLADLFSESGAPLAVHALEPSGESHAVVSYQPSAAPSSVSHCAGDGSSA